MYDWAMLAVRFVDLETVMDAGLVSVVVLATVVAGHGTMSCGCGGLRR